jgi:hypothetical protein
MMPPRTILLLAISAVFCFPFAASAQNFVIRHDFQRDSTRFFRLGKHNDTTSVRGVAVKKPGHITLEVENFNPFYWDAKVTSFERPVDEQSSYIQVFRGLAKTVGIDLAIPGVSRGRAGSEQTYSRLKIVYEKANDIKFVESDLQALKFDRYKTEAEIKTQASANIARITGQTDISSNDVLAMGTELDRQMKELSDSLTLVPPAFSFQQELSVVSNLYHQIMFTSYRFTYVVTGKPDINELKLDIFPKGDSTTKDTLTRFFTVQAKPYLRIRNSVGVSFTYFQDKNTSYFIKPDSTIGKGAGDLFTPVLSFLLHFYNYQNAGFKWGGSFGFGIPLLGEKKDINFLLGLCTLLGRNEPVIISAGIAGTKVDRLSSGWKTGRQAPNLAFQVPTTSQFRAGGFISISFNINSLSPKGQN